MIITMYKAEEWLRQDKARLSGYTHDDHYGHSYAVIDHYDHMATYHCLDDDRELMVYYNGTQCD